MLKATLTLEGTLDQIERAASVLIAAGKIEALHAVEEHLTEAEKRLMTHVNVPDGGPDANPPLPTENVSETEQSAIDAQERVLTREKRKHRKKNKLAEKVEKAAEPAPAPETPEDAAPAPETPSAPDTPDTETLKGLVVNAVKAARAGGDGKILNLLPEFKKATKLPFVMEAKDEHRGALLDLLNKAGIAVE